ncbi:MAG: penicillin-binding transpeptidase domain-containing protein [Burkholderiales bacterium]
MAASVALVAALLLPPHAVPPAHAGGSAVAISHESAARLLERRFADTPASYVLMDAATGIILASNLDQDRPRPLGSLLKPFTAIAYGEAHAFEYPRYECKGTTGGCWRPRGHGRIGIVEAIAHSCNAYFRSLSSQLRAQDVSTTLERFGLGPMDAHAGSAALFGAGDTWRATPRDVLRAYLEIAKRSAQPGAREVVQGMRLAAQSGTGEAVGRAVDADALVKTGTAPCTHARRSSGDGYAIVIYPADAPQFALLVSVHGAPGSQAAATAGEMLRVLTDQPGGRR